MFNKLIFGAILVLLVLVYPVFGQVGERIRIALVDFGVASKNPDFENLGKGFVEFIAVDLSKARQIMLIDREKRNQLLSEQEFSMSEVADETQAVRIGQLLAAQYLLSGEIFDIAGNISITFQVVNVATGEIEFKDKVSGKIDAYDSLCSEIARRTLTGLKVEVPATVAAVAEEKKAKPAQAVVAFADAVAAVDKNDTKTAKEKLKSALQYDPKNEAAAQYLAKLAGASPRFRVELDTFAMASNPAYNGLLEEDSIYTTLSINPATVRQSDLTVDVGDNIKAVDGFSNNYHLGYRFPLGSTLGMNIEAALSPLTSHIEGITVMDGVARTAERINAQTIGLGLGLGWQVVKGFSVGLAGIGQYAKGEKVFSDSDKPVLPLLFEYAIIGGIVCVPVENFLTLDFQTVYSSLTLPSVDTSDMANLKMTTAQLPVIFDSTATFTLLNQQLFVAVKEIGEWYIQNNGGVVLKTVGLAEFWPLPMLGLRAGYEFVYLNMASKTVLGHGGIAGLSVKLGNFDIDLNGTYRSNPLRVLPGYSYNQFIVMAGVSFRPEWLKR